MSFLDDEERKQIRKVLEALKGPVSLALFTHEGECESCAETRELMEELANLAEGLSLESYDLDEDADKAEELGISRAPAVAILGARDYGVRYYGLPTGYEFGALLEDLVDISEGKTEIGSKTRRNLAKLATPVHIEVYTTPTCPVCPHMVRTAHKLAIESDLIRADAIDSIEFIDEAEEHGIETVPRTIVNKSLSLEGLVPEGKLIVEILKELQEGG